MNKESIILFRCQTDCRTGDQVKPQRARARRRWPLSGKQTVALVVVLIIAYLAYGFLFPAVITVTNTRSFSLGINQTQFIRLYNGSTVALKLRSASAQSASFYISRVPVLYSPVVSLSLSPLGSLNVSTDGSNTADMNMLLLTTSNRSVTVQITPLAAAFGIKSSPGISLLIPSSLTSAGSGSGNLNVVTSTTTSTVTTAVSTVAQNTTQVLFQSALKIINKTNIGILMKNYNKLYSEDVACSQTAYNSAYNIYYHTLPSGPTSFANISAETPTAITISENALTVKNRVRITYSTVSSFAETTGPAVLATVNTSSSTLTTYNFTSTGIYSGLNYTVLNNAYAFQSAVIGYCGAYISPPP